MSGQESTDTARGRSTGGADEESSAGGAGPASSVPAEGGVGDAWVVGAWSTEGWMSATSPEPEPLDDDNLEDEAIRAGAPQDASAATPAGGTPAIVVGAPTVDGASRASKTLDWLIAHGHAAHVADAVVVLSSDRVSKDVDRARVREHFEARCRAVVEVPHDPHLATGERIELSRLRPPTQDAFLALAAHLADGFAATPRSAEPAGRRV